MCLAALRLASNYRVSSTATCGQCKLSPAMIEAAINIRGFQLFRLSLETEAPACHLAGVVSRQTSPANVRPHGVDRACRRDAYASHKRCTAITAASHPSLLAIDIRVGNSIEIGVTFQ